MRFNGLLLALALVVGEAEAGKRVKADLVEDALAFAATDRDKAARLLEDAITNDGNLTDEQRDVLRVHAGEQRRLLGQRDPAWDQFRAVVDGGRPIALDAGKLGIALLDAERGVDADVAIRLREPAEKDVIATQNADRYRLLALHAHATGDDAAFRELGKRALSFAKDDAQVYERIREALDRVEPAKAGAKTGPEASRAPIERAEDALADGRRDDAIRIADEVIAASPDSDDARVARYLKKRIEVAAFPDPTKIGVLIPLSGKYETVGKQMQKALEIGYGGGTRRLVYVDAGETPETALAGLEKLVFDEHVIAVVGPLRTEGALDLAKAADAMRVPLVSLAQVTDLTDGRPWVLQAMPTPEDQVKGLLDFAMGTKGMDAFAVFAPDNAYGRLATEVFESEVKARGGAITVRGFYDPASTNVGESAKTLGRKDYEARKEELTELKKLTEKNGGDPSKVVLPPILDFDAMFVPDSASRLPIACAGLAYEEFPMGEFKPTKTSTTFPLLGLSGWNADTLVTTGGPYVRGGFFTDVYRAGIDPAFEERFRAETGHGPTALEAVAVDVGALLAATARTPAKTPLEFRDAMLAAKVDGAVTGTGSFDPATRDAAQKVRIFSVTAKAIVEIDPNPPPPAPPEGTVPPAP